MNRSKSNNKTIAINTIIVYARLIITSLIGLVTVRFVLQALGASDYGLYNVVGGIVAMLNVICTAMQTTTRRYINVEMGKPNGDLNKIYNVSVVLHIGFALFLLIIAETLGLYYIYNYLNVDNGKFEDALFVYQISTIVAIIGVINVPCQGLLSAYENFKSLSIVDIIASLFKIPIVISLMFYPGNLLRFYAVCMCLISFATFLIYQCMCSSKYKKVVKVKLYKDTHLYKEILAFNNYTALGAFSYIGRTQGSNMLINYVFGTFVNGLFAIAYQIESYLMLIVNNLSISFEPQITQTYSAGDYNRCYKLVSNITRYSILIMLLFAFPLSVNFEFILKLWLGSIPEGVLVLCYWTLCSLFVRSLTAGMPPIIIATGNVRAFQISTTILMLVGLPISFFCYRLEFPCQTILIVMTIFDFLNRLYLVYLVKKITNMNVSSFVCNSYKSILLITPFLCCFWWTSTLLDIDGLLFSFIKIFVSGLYGAIFIFMLGLNKDEKQLILKKLHLC